MGWIGAGVAIATTAWFLYRYPPSSWAEPRSFAPPGSEPKPEASLATTTPDESEEKHAPRASTPIEPEEDNQTTPKAAASSAPLPVLTVPELKLNSESGTSQPTTMPPISQATLGAPSQSLPKDRSDEASMAPPPPSFAPQPKQASPRTAPGASSLMPPPPIPRPTPQPNRLAPTNTLQPPRLSGSSLGPPPSAAASQRGPPMTSTGTRQVNSTLAPTPLTLKKNNKRVILEPGFSPLDWAALAANPKNQLRGENLPQGLLRVTPSMLKEQHGRKGRDAWTSYQGKVYNISPYAPYHPGGKGELLRGAGKDSAQLFQEIHPWVNWEGILGECLVGILVSENDLNAENTLDAMD